MAKGKTIDLVGYPIRTAPYKENDCMVSFLSEEGLFSFLARGIKKPTAKNAAAMGVLVKSEVSLESFGQSLTLKESKIISSIDPKDLKVASSLMFLSELSSKSIEEGEGQENYIWLDKCLSLLKDGFHPFTAVLIYLAKTLSFMGFGLNVDSCIVCSKKKGIVYCSCEEGGFLCEEHAEGRSDDLRKLKMMRYIFALPIEDFGRVSFEDLESVHLIKELSEYLLEMSGIRLKSLEILEKSI